MADSDTQTVTIHYDDHTVYELKSPSAAKGSQPLVVRIRTFLDPKEALDPVNHPIHGERRVYYASLEALTGLGAANDNRQSSMTTQAHPVAVKWSRGKHAIEDLSKEGRLYATALAELQGSVVPRCYGYFEGTIEGVDIGCLVLERCGKRLTCATDMETNRKIMLAVSKLHCAGIYHGDIYDGRHLLLAPDRTVRIIDFSKARIHECTNTVPYLFNEGTGEVSAGCQELEDMESFFGMYSGSWNATKRKPPTRRLKFAAKPNNVIMNGPA